MRNLSGIAVALASASVVLAPGVSGCDNVIAVEDGGPSTSTGLPPVPPSNATTSDKIDLLLVVDNSASMSDKQEILAASIPKLLGGLANPACVDADGVPVPTQPASPVDACPDGTQRVFPPITSMHLGVIDSSLGGVGSNSCLATPGHNNDHAYLLNRGPHGVVPTYLDQGFLAWDPTAQLAPPGESDFGSFVQNAVDIVSGAGQDGCGYEMQLESAYRFLADPSPYDHIQGGDELFSLAKPVGLDTTLLAERSQFLRNDSLVAVVLLTDENDCSINVGAPDVGSQGYSVLNSSPFFRSTAVCATNPNDSCCYSCGLGPPTGCIADDACLTPKYTDFEDSVNLRCWNQKKRYGFDALYPVQRYINAFSLPRIDPSQADLSVVDPATSVANPLFQKRDTSLFVMSNIVGVPWQLIAVDPSNASQGMYDAQELTDHGLWDLIAGDPDQHIEPTDPIMIESTEPRGPTSTDPNGGDRTIGSPRDDLQFACIFDLQAPISNSQDCTDSKNSGPDYDNPICDAANPTTQIAAKAYPGLRELAVARGLGHQALVGSICAPTSDRNASSFGYNLPLASLLDRMAGSIEGHR